MASTVASSRREAGEGTCRTGISAGKQHRDLWGASICLDMNRFTPPLRAAACVTCIVIVCKALTGGCGLQHHVGHALIDEVQFGAAC